MTKQKLLEKAQTINTEVGGLLYCSGNRIAQNLYWSVFHRIGRHLKTLQYSFEAATFAEAI